MAVEQWSENVFVVRLADDPQFTDDLDALDHPLSSRSGAARGIDLVLDFSCVQLLNSSNIARLLRLRKQSISHDGRLVMCGVSTQVWGSFLITGLDKIFEWSDSVTTALATLQMA